MNALLRSCLAGAVVLAMSVRCVSAQVAKDVAVIIKAQGNVQINKSSDGQWQIASRGGRLDASNQVRTGDASLAALVFTDDKSMLKVRSNSTVVINGTRQQNRVAKSIYMEAGELWAKVTKGRSEFRVETPSGVAAVKGTEFYGILDSAGNLFIFCIDGIVELFNRLGRELVERGYTGRCSANEAPETSLTDPNELPDWGQDTDEGGEIEIEFQDEGGNKKRMKIRYQ